MQTILSSYFQIIQGDTFAVKLRHRGSYSRMTYTIDRIELAFYTNMFVL